jgi:hypothetical protein
MPRRLSTRSADMATAGSDNRDDRGGVRHVLEPKNSGAVRSHVRVKMGYDSIDSSNGYARDQPFKATEFGKGCTRKIARKT